MAKLGPRDLMLKALEVMRASSAERRSDQKVSPQVGAVLWGGDAIIGTAARGELRDGDHAEFTLLERKHRAARLDGAVLFVTLEPCAPGARHPPKLSCAERIVLARIKEVWVGIEDPDPTVDRRGIRFLQEHGVAVRMFDRDLQEQIRAANHDFLAQALERAAAATDEHGFQPVTLSPLEGALPSAAWGDLSQEALTAYAARLGLPASDGDHELRRRLLHLKLLADQAGRMAPTGFGALLFGAAPRTLLPQAGVLATLHLAGGREEPRDFDGPQVLVPGALIAWLRDRLDAPIRRDDAERRDVHGALFELIREGIVNAIVHRDYSIEGAKCQVHVSADRIRIMSPGLPVAPITVEQLQAFDAPMLSRNPVLHFVFAQMKLAEERGLGLKSLRARAQAAGLPLPTYHVEPPYLVLTLFLAPDSAARLLPAAARARLGRHGPELVAVASRLGTFSAMQAGAELGLDARATQRALARLVALGVLVREGQGPATRYRFVRT